MTPITTHLLQEEFRHTVGALNRLHSYTVEADPAEVATLHKLWELVDDYQTKLTQLIQEATRASSPT